MSVPSDRLARFNALRSVHLDHVSSLLSLFSAFFLFQYHQHVFVVSDLLLNWLHSLFNEAFMGSASDNLRLGGSGQGWLVENLWLLVRSGKLYWLIDRIGMGTQVINIGLLHLNVLRLHLYLLLSPLLHHLACSSSLGSAEFAEDDG